jgi:hypothetical protein
LGGEDGFFPANGGRASSFSPCGRVVDQQTGHFAHAWQRSIEGPMPVEIGYPLIGLAFFAIYALAADILVQVRRGQ